MCYQIPLLGNYGAGKAKFKPFLALSRVSTFAVATLHAAEGHHDVMAVELGEAYSLP